MLKRLKNRLLNYFKTDDQKLDIEFMDAEKQTHIKETKPYFRNAVHIIMLFFTIAIIWAYFAKLDEITRASGKVIPSSKTQVIQYLEGGILSEMLVNEGDVVEKGQVLLKIDDTRFTSDHQENRRKYLALLGSVTRLRAEATDQDEVEFPQLLIDEAPNVVQREKGLFKFKRDQLKSKLATTRKTHNLAKQELSITAPLVKQGVMSELELIRIKRQVAELEGEIDSTQDDYNSKAQTELTEQAGKLASLEAALTGMEDHQYMEK